MSKRAIYGTDIAVFGPLVSDQAPFPIGARRRFIRFTVERWVYWMGFLLREAFSRSEPRESDLDYLKRTLGSAGNRDVTEASLTASGADQISKERRLVLRDFD